MKLLDNYKEAVSQYYDISDIGKKSSERPSNLSLEPTRMLLLLVYNEEGFSAGECYKYFEFTKSRESSYYDLSIAKAFYESDRAFKRRYNEILKLINDERISKREVV